MSATKDDDGAAPTKRTKLSPSAASNDQTDPAVAAPDAASKQKTSAAPATQAAKPGTIERIQSLLQKLGQPRPDWLYLIDDQLDETSTKNLRLLLDEYGKRQDDKRDLVNVIKMTAREDLTRSKFTTPDDERRFNIGTFNNDPDQEETITVSKAAPLISFEKTDSLL